MQASLLTLALGATTFAVWYTVSRWRQRKKYPPGPSPWPIIGNLPLTMNKKKKLWVTMTDLQKEYGDLFTVFFARQPTIILGNLDLVREAFLTKQNDFAGRPSTYSFDIFTRGGKDILGGQFGPIWKRQRKIVHAAMRQFASGDVLAKLIYDGTRKAFKNMDKEAELGRPVNPKNHLEMIIYNIISSMVFGKTFEHDDPFFREFVMKNNEFNEVFGDGLLADIFPIFKYIPTRSLRLLKEVAQFMFNLVEGTYEEHRKTYDDSHLRDFVDYMLQTCEEAEKADGKAATEGLELDHYLLSILDIFSAGTDTSKLTLWWAVLYMSAYPEIQKKLQDEVDAIVGGYIIPKGTQVMPNYWAIHMNPEHWDEPEAFKPERFLGDDGRMGPRISSWLPFSTGRRVCVGEAVAKAELHLTIASLAQRYNFAVPAGVIQTIDEKTTGQIMIPKDYEVLITKRV